MNKKSHLQNTLAPQPSNSKQIVTCSWNSFRQCIHLSWIRKSISSSVLYHIPIIKNYVPILRCYAVYLINWSSQIHLRLFHFPKHNLFKIVHSKLWSSLFRPRLTSRIKMLLLIMMPSEHVLSKISNIFSTKPVSTLHLMI